MAQMKPLAWMIGALLALPGTVLAQDVAAPLDDQARVRMGEGDASGALQLMQDHVAAHPDDRDARLDLVRYLTWNGNFVEAERVLLADPAAAQTVEGKSVHAALLAWAGRIDAARAENAPVLAAEPDNYLGHYTEAVALRQSARPRQALPHVAEVERLKPGSKDAIDLARSTRIRTGSVVALDYVHTDDSDDLITSRPTLRADLAQGEALHYTIELGRWDNRSPTNSPFVAIDGGNSIAQTRGLIGLRYASSLRTEWSAAVGHSSMDGDGTLLWRAGVDHRANDSWRLGLSADRDRLAISPRSLSLGLTRHGALGQVHWTPDMLWTGDLMLRRDDYSDGNDSTEWSMALRRAVVRRPGVMLDLGAMVQHISHDKNLGNGYYAPDNYRRYGLTASSYFGLSDEVGLSVQAGLGRQRDETFTSWRRANDLGASLVFGIYTPWQFTVFAGYSERVQTTGAYEGYSWGMTLARRF